MKYISNCFRNRYLTGSFFVCIGFVLNLFLISPGTCNEETIKIVPVGRFSESNIENWDKKLFKGESRYRLIQLDGRTVLEAESSQSASGLVKKIKVNLTQTPFLNWSWRVEKAHAPLEEKKKQGDDYAARVYLVVDGGMFFWKTIALNYVWSSSQSKGNVWASSYAQDNVMLMALRSSSDHLSTWHKEKRNVYEDFKSLFEREISHIDAVAIMTDSDNSGGDVRAYYGDIFFSSE